MAGVYQITAEVPLGIQGGDAIPVVVVSPPDPSLLARGTHGLGRESNRITIAVEQPQP
jgi:hypothetical protein